jgi:hypothetical protein
VMAATFEIVHVPTGWRDVSAWNVENGFSVMDWQYPGPACRGGTECASCPRFRCPHCMKLRPWCVGAASGGATASWCDACRACLGHRVAATEMGCFGPKRFGRCPDCIDGTAGSADPPSLRGRTRAKGEK